MNTCRVPQGHAFHKSKVAIKVAVKVALKVAVKVAGKQKMMCIPNGAPYTPAVSRIKQKFIEHAQTNCLVALLTNTAAK